MGTPCSWRCDCGTCRGVPCGRLSAGEPGASSTGFAVCPTIDGWRCAKQKPRLLNPRWYCCSARQDENYLVSVYNVTQSCLWLWCENRPREIKLKVATFPLAFEKPLLIVPLSMTILKERATRSPGKQLCEMLNSFSSPWKTELNLSLYIPPFKKAFFDQNSGNHIALPFFLAPEIVSGARDGPGNWIHLFCPQTYRAAIIHHHVSS